MNICSSGCEKNESLAEQGFHGPANHDIHDI